NFSSAPGCRQDPQADEGGQGAAVGSRRSQELAGPARKEVRTRRTDAMELDTILTLEELIAQGLTEAEVERLCPQAPKYGPAAAPYGQPEDLAPRRGGDQ